MCRKLKQKLVRVECIPTFESCSTLSMSNLSSNSKHTLPRKKKNEDTYLENVLKIENQKVAFLQQSNNNVTISEVDEDMSFFQSLILYFKN